MPGSGKLRLTGQLGSVMKESAHAALSWIRSHASQVPSELLSRYGVCVAANDVTCGLWWVVSLVLHRVRWLTRTSTFIFPLGPFPRTYVFPHSVYYVSGGDLLSLKPNHCPLCVCDCMCALFAGPFRWHCHHHSSRVVANTAMCTMRHSHDWRGHVKGIGAPCGWHQGEAAWCPSRWHSASHTVFTQ